MTNLLECLCMREFDVTVITNEIERMAGKIACFYHPDIKQAIIQASQNETSDRSKTAINMLIENADIAESENIPLCQDTGLMIVWLHVGQEVHFINGDINEAIHEGVRRGYTNHYLRASSVSDPLFERKNTKDNTPAIIYYDIIPGNKVKIEVMAKGFGSENKSALKMLTPADGVEGVKKFVLETIKNAGPNACPPFIVGVGIGGTFESAAKMSKEALLRPLSQSNADERYRQLEDELLIDANKLHIGPMGFHGNTTCLKVQINYAPTHIAGLPVAINMCCHVCRHDEVEL